MQADLQAKPMPAPEEFQTDSFCNNWVVGSDRFKTTIYDDRRFNENDAIGSSNLVKAKLLDVNMYSANGAAMVTVPYGWLDVPVATVEAYGFDRVGIVGMDKGAMVSIFSSIEANPDSSPASEPVGQAA
jgi:hypothetical protein